jgi:uncharacterized protein (DUF2252 family)
VRRSTQAVWDPPHDRTDPVDLLVTGNRGKVRELLPIRYARMAASPFGFLRGAAGIMAKDLADTPCTGLRVQLVGDAHVGNFGLFATPERDQVFDANDFDETIAGPWEWDLKRLATSLVLVGRGNQLPRGVVRDAGRTAARAYRTHLQALARMRYLDTWYSHLDLAEASHEVGPRGLRLLQKELPAARQRTGYHAFPRLVRVAGGRARIRDASPLLRHFPRPGDEAIVREAFRRYRSTLPAERCALFDRYRLVDVAQKVVGVGSVGMRCAIGLFLADPDVTDPLFLQVKEAVASVHEPFVGRSPYRNHAERVVVGQRLIQEASDIFLGWGPSGSRDFYVRQLRDMKFASDLTTLGPRQLLGQAELCGTALARAHARTGDAAAIAGYLGQGEAFDQAITRFAEAYARQTEEDHAALRRAIATGRLPAAP